MALLPPLPPAFAFNSSHRPTGGGTLVVPMNGRVTSHPTLDALGPAFAPGLTARERLEVARPLLDGSHPVMAAFAMAARDATRGGLDGCGIAVRVAARHDGGTIAEAQQFFGCFNPTRRPELSAWQFAAMREADLSAIAARAASTALDLVDPGGHRTVGIWLYPVDHANAHSMLRLHGLEAWGDLGGVVALQAWPSPGTVRRVGPVVTRAVALGVRGALAWPDGRPPTLADHLAREGIASHAVGAAFPALEHPWAAPFTPAPDWDDALRIVATTIGVASYAEVRVNTYGTVLLAGDDRYPSPPVPDADDLAYARAVLLDDLSARDPARIAGYLYGDLIVAHSGHPPVGMSPFAGLTAAHAMVGESITRRGLDLASACRMPAADLLDGAFG